MPSTRSNYRKRLRVRVCGLLIEDDAVLLTEIHSPVANRLVWIPPGGGLEYGETMEACLKREFVEETHLHINVCNLIHINELVDPPYHALEHYFEVERAAGEPQLGQDPELPDNQQLLNDLQWIPVRRLPDISFAPQGLLLKLQDWKHRFSYPIFAGYEG